MQDLIESFSGIRGIYGQSITEELARKYAWCYCDFLKQKKEDLTRPHGDRVLRDLVVGGDSRDSTPVLKKAMLNTFSAQSIKRIIDVGIVPVQVCEYAVLRFKAQGGVYISASHNEPEYNGWKFLKEDGALIYASHSERLIKAVHRLPDNFNFSYAGGKSRVEKKQSQAINFYIDYILRKLNRRVVEDIRKANFKILFDPNGGSSIPVLAKLISKLNLKAKILNGIMGVFNHMVEPNTESLEYLNKYLENKKFEFAVGFDSDADRVELVIDPASFFAQEMGPVVNGNYVLSLACDSLLKGTSKQVVVTNDVTSYLVRDVVKMHQAKTKEVEAGEMVIVEEMEKQRSIIGGEGSNGGVIIPPIKCRDGIMTLCLILKMLVEEKKSLVDILQKYPKYYSSHNKAACSSEKSIAIKQGLERYFRAKKYRIKKTGGKTGGLKAELDKNSFVWFRQSKTEPGVFRLYVEGDDKAKVKQLARESIKIFNKLSAG